MSLFLKVVKFCHQMEMPLYNYYFYIDPIDSLPHRKGTLESALGVWLQNLFKRQKFKCANTEKENSTNEVYFGQFV